MIDVTVQWRTLLTYRIILFILANRSQPQTERPSNQWFYSAESQHRFWKRLVLIGLTLNPSGFEYRSSNSWTRTIKINNPGCYSGFKPVMHLEMNFSFIWTSIFKIRIWFFKSNPGIWLNDSIRIELLGIKFETNHQNCMRPIWSWVINYDVSRASKTATIFWSSGANRITNVISKCLHQWLT